MVCYVGKDFNQGYADEEWMGLHNVCHLLFMGVYVTSSSIAMVHATYEVFSLCI
jgi:hypothetical protein